MNEPCQKAKVVVICGPTGVGKTGFALELAQVFRGEIIGADSMQIYRHMDIGTAKPDPNECARVRHHMVDIVDPDEPFDARKYAAMAFQKVSDLTKRGMLPFVVGGTGLYIKSLVFGLFEAETGDPQLRERLKIEARERGSRVLHQRLAACDPATAARLHGNDTYRIIRALEIFEITGIPMSEHHRRHRFRTRRLDTLSIGLSMERERLYERIDVRVDAMIRAGLLDEVQRLLDAGYAPELKSMQSIGYRHMVDYIRNPSDWQETVRTMKRDTRRYAKRQLTWFKADPTILWVSPREIGKAESAVRSFINTCPKETPN